MMFEEVEDKNEHCQGCEYGDTCWKDIFTECPYELE